MSAITAIVKQLTIDGEEHYVVFYYGGGYKVYRELPDELKDFWDTNDPEKLQHIKE